MNGAFWSFSRYRDLNAHSSNFWGILVIFVAFRIFCRVFFWTFYGFRGYFGNFGDLGVCWPFKGFQGYFLVQFSLYKKSYKYSKTPKMIPLKLRKELKCTTDVKNFPKP